MLIVIGPTIEQAQSFCKTMNIPKYHVRAAIPAHLYGHGRDFVFLIYNSSMIKDYERLKEVLEVGRPTIIEVPEVVRLNRV